MPQPSGPFPDLTSLSDALPAMSETITSSDDFCPQPVPAADSSAHLTLLPNELLLDIFEQLPARDLIRVGQTCQKLREVVNAPVTSSKIIRRETHRLVESDKVPTLVGLSLIEAFRQWVLYYSRFATMDIFNACSDFASQYKCENGIKPTSSNRLEASREARFISSLTEYLYHLDHVAHYNPNGPDRRRYSHHPVTSCRCKYCRPQSPHCWIEKAVRTYSETGWQHEQDPKDFWEEVGTKSMAAVIPQKEWLEMVKSVLQEPIQQYTIEEAAQSRMMLFKAIDFSLPAAIPFNSVAHSFVHLAQLPTLKKGLKSYMLKQIPAKFDLVSKRLYHESNGTSTAERAVMELYAEFFRQRRESPCEKLVDPENRLLKAHILENLLVVPGGHYSSLYRVR